MFTWHWFDPSNLPPSRILAPGRPHMYSCMILELIRTIKYTPPVIGPHNSKLPVLTEVSSCDQLGLTVNLVPERNLLIRDVPQPNLAVQGPANKELVVPGMKPDGSDKINMLEYTQTFFPGDMPEPDCLVHR